MLIIMALDEIKLPAILTMVLLYRHIGGVGLYFSVIDNIHMSSQFYTEHFYREAIVGYSLSNA